MIFYYQKVSVLNYYFTVTVTVGLYVQYSLFMYSHESVHMMTINYRYERDNAPILGLENMRK